MEIRSEDSVEREVSRAIFFPSSYVEIIIAHAGATFRHRATQPRKSPAVPSSRKMCIRNFGNESCSGRRFATVLPPDTAEGGDASPMCRNTCCRVFPTSNGVVTNAAREPDVAPAIKLSMNVGASGSSGCSCAAGNICCPWALLRASMRRVFTSSYPHQYKPENGTSRHIVRVNPRQSELYPLTWVIWYRSSRVSLKCPVPEPEPEVACSRVRNISMGLMADAAAILAVVPATNGAYVSGKDRLMGLRSSDRNQSYPAK